MVVASEARVSIGNIEIEVGLYEAECVLTEELQLAAGEASQDRPKMMLINGRHQ